MCARLHFRDQPTDALEVCGIRLLQRLQLVGQNQRGVIIVSHMLVIFCQMLKGWYALALGETVPDQHGCFPKTTAFVQ